MKLKILTLFLLLSCVSSTAQNIGDSTDLAWLDSNFDNVGETNKYLVPEEDSNSSFSLVANSTETGQYGCAHIDLSLINVIKSIRKSQGALTCELLKPATGNTALYVTSVSTGETHSYEIPVGQNSIDVNLLNEGAIIATLRVNGKTMNSLQIIK